MPTKVIVAAEQNLYLEAFKSLLEANPELRVAVLAGARAEAAAVVSREQPDVAVVICAADSTFALVDALAPAARVIVVGCRGPFEASRAFGLGARGVVGATQTPSELFAAIRSVAGGASYVPSWPPVAEEVATTPVNPLTRLSPRERQVFERLIEGDSNSEIGRRLGISAKTVDTHRTHVMRKMGVHSVVQLVRFAARHELLPEPESESPRSALA